MKRNRPQPPTRPRQGSVLLAVLVVIMLLSLGAYAFTELMILEHQSAVLYGRDAQARAFADSGLEQVMALLGTRAELQSGENFYHDPQLFQSHLIVDGPVPRARGGFSIVAPVENDPTARMVRFGLIDESGKINVNAILKLELSEDELNYMLMALPGMTPEIADAILDYIDEDITPRPYSAIEDEYNKNGPLASLDELLNVPGIRENPWLLIGEDWNRNGLMDPGEDANGDGILDVGWSAYLTIHSRESNRRLDGTERLYVNDNLLSDLWDQLAELYGEDEATFVVAYRLNGPLTEEGEDGQNPGGVGSGERGGSDGGRSGDQESEEALQRLAQDVARGIASGGTGEQANRVTRGGMDLTAGGQHQINSLYDLVGAQVEATIEGEPQTLDSPWSADPGAMAAYLPLLLEDLSVSREPFIEGRININQARYETLLAIPGMTPELAAAIYNSKLIGSNGEPLTDVIGTHATTGWLVMEGHVDLPTMRQLDRFITTRGDVYRVQAVGHYFEGGPTVRLEAVIDAAQYPPRLVALRDLSHLGRGYSPSQLVPAQAVTR
ncbi:MAG TPA: hypothetical protein VML55_10375 [Planctomycetaceae bacterium]|nr:hypothetical protein [Planctomycetaceae bacterium]